MAAATLYSLVKDLGTIGGGDLVDLTIGMVVSFITSLLAMGWLLRYISKHSFKGFAVYRVLAGVAVLVLFGW